MSAGEPGLCRPTAPPSAHCPLPPPQGMDEVAASRTALQCLLESQDYAGSLELLGNLGHMVDRQLGLGIRAFKETRPQVGDWRVAVVNGPLLPEAGKLADILRGEIGRHWVLLLLTASPHTCITAQVDETLEVVESLLACEFLTLANMQVGGGGRGGGGLFHAWCIHGSWSPNAAPEFSPEDCNGLQDICSIMERVCVYS